MWPGCAGNERRFRRTHCRQPGNNRLACPGRWQPLAAPLRTLTVAGAAYQFALVTWNSVRPSTSPPGATFTLSAQRWNCSSLS